MRTKKRSIFNPVELGADLETDHNKECTEAWICQWAVSQGDWDTKRNCPMGWTGRGLEGLAKTLKYLMDRYGHIRVWFHNFAYDDSYLHQMYLDWESEIGKSGYVPDGKWDNPIYLINEGRPVIIRFKFDNDHTVTFCDSLRKMGNTLSEIAEMMDMEKLVPPAQDFHPGWSEGIDYTNTHYYDPDWKYVVNDAYVVAKFIQKTVGELKQTGATYSSDAFKEGKKMVGDGKYKGWESKWKRCMPSLIEDAEENIGKQLLVTDEILREGYFGGINMSQFKEQGLLRSTPERRIYHIDYNSMYPSQMVNRPLPKGYCIKATEGGFPETDPTFLPKSMCYVAVMRVKLHLKKGKLPWFTPKSAHSLDNVDALDDPNWKSGSHVVDTDVWHWVTLTDIDLGTLRMCYDVEVDPDNDPMFYWFYTEKGLLEPYINKYYTLKSDEKAKGKERDELKYAHYKVMMNSFYGRTGMNPHREQVTLSDDPEDFFKWLRAEYYEPNIETYIPYAMYVTAWARRQLVVGWEAVGMENVIHSDTDSIIFFGSGLPAGLEINDLGLDCWGNECPKKGDYTDTSIEAFYEGGLKRYVEFYHYPPQRVKDVKITCAGVPNHKYRHAKLDADGNPIKVDGKTVFDEYPNQMGVELYDDPSLIQMDGYELGHEHYMVKSDWLRAEIMANGGNPDDMDTRKLMPKMVKGGKILMPNTYKISDNMRIRLK